MAEAHGVTGISRKVRGPLAFPAGARVASEALERTRRRAPAPALELICVRICVRARGPFNIAIQLTRRAYRAAKSKIFAEPRSPLRPFHRPGPWENGPIALMWPIQFAAGNVVRDEMRCEIA